MNKERDLKEALRNFITEFSEHDTELEPVTTRASVYRNRKVRVYRDAKNLLYALDIDAQEEHNHK